MKLATRLLIGSTIIVTGILSAQTPPDHITFNLEADPRMAACIADNSGQAPTAVVTVDRLTQNDFMTIHVTHIKPGLAFDVFTVQRSAFLASGALNPQFAGFGLAWYQSDLQIDSNGNGSASVRSILLDQIFGFDADAPPLTPRHTFNVGFWFNNPNDAAACGFNPAKPTPFNGDHRAGPMAMMSAPNPATHIGPLCTNPDFSTNPTSCKP